MALSWTYSGEVYALFAAFQHRAFCDELQLSSVGIALDEDLFRQAPLPIIWTHNAAILKAGYNKAAYVWKCIYSEIVSFVDLGIGNHPRHALHLINTLEAHFFRKPWKNRAQNILICCS